MSHTTTGPAAALSRVLVCILVGLFSASCLRSSNHGERAAWAEEGQARAYLECECRTPPRWVLRDADGDRVAASVEPRCGQGDTEARIDRCLPLDFGASRNFPCVRVIDHESRHVNLEYDLESGTLAPCNLPTGIDPMQPWTSIDVSVVYLDDSCEGDAFKLYAADDGEFDGFTSARKLDWVAGEVWYASEEGCLSPPGGYWARSTQAPYTCGNGILQAGMYVCPLKPVPAWVSGLLPNPPYTMAVEYE